MLLGLAAAAVPVLLHLVQRRQPPTVLFPAVRYLVATTQEHQRRLKLRNLLLLLLRTLLIVVLVLAASAPTIPQAGVPGHAPSAMVVVVDNSPSSAAIVDGIPRLDVLRNAARAALVRATAEDDLWLLTADGSPRRETRAALGSMLDSLAVSPRRLDLGLALDVADAILRAQPKPGQVMLFTDLQATAVTPSSVTTPVTVVRPTETVAGNVGIGDVAPSPLPWSVDGGRIRITLAGDSTRQVPVSARIGPRPPRQALGGPSVPVELALAAPGPGWWAVRVDLAPDELRSDDAAEVAVRVAPVAAVRWDTTDRYVSAAGEVLERNGRIRRGDEVTLGTLGRGASVLQPPTDPARLGALNRALERRGVGWRFGGLVEGAEATDSSALLDAERVSRRYALEPVGSGRTGVVATVGGGAPWVVRGAGVVLLGSRLDPEWTSLPVSAAFMPFLDALLNRIARGELASLTASPGTPTPLPDAVGTVVREGRRWSVEGGASFVPVATGAHYLLAGGDTVGTLSVITDPRESVLGPATDRAVRRLWAGARVVAPSEAGDEAFTTGARGDLRGPLLWMALVLGLAEVGLAASRGRAR